MTPSLLSSKLSKTMQSESFRAKSAHHKRMILLAEKIYGRRKDLALSQGELAKKAGTTQRIISELENAFYAPEKGIGEELYDKLAAALEIDRDYLFSEKINRRTFELYTYIGKKLDWEWNIMQFMKIPYFIDLEAVKTFGFPISNLAYVRYEFGPFDKSMYVYRSLFEQKSYDIQFSYISDFTDFIDRTLAPLPLRNGEKLKRLSYDTEPMKRIRATLGGKEAWNEKLVLNVQKGG